jgi:hypothetical protein
MVWVMEKRLPMPAALVGEVASLNKRMFIFGYRSDSTLKRIVTASQRVAEPTPMVFRGPAKCGPKTNRRVDASISLRIQMERLN